MGYYVTGLPGLLKAGISFMLPSTSIVMIISMFFANWIPESWVQVVLDGMAPVILLMIAQVSRYYKSCNKT